MLNGLVRRAADDEVALCGSRRAVSSEKQPGLECLDCLGGDRGLVRILRQPEVWRDDGAALVAEQGVS